MQGNSLAFSIHSSPYYLRLLFRKFPVT